MSISNKEEAKDTFSDLLKLLTHDEVATLTEMLADFGKSKEEGLHSEITLFFREGFFRGYEHTKKRKSIIP
jgi:hypothetical protein